MFGGNNSIFIVVCGEMVTFVFGAHFCKIVSHYIVWRATRCSENGESELGEEWRGKLVLAGFPSYNSVSSRSILGGTVIL